MKLTSLLILIIGISLPVATIADSAIVYEKVEPDGVTDFSDKSSPGAVVELVRDPNLIKPVTMDSPETAVNIPQEKPRHITVNILKPVPQKSFWSGNGDIEVSF